MADEIRIWAIGGSGEVLEVEPTDRTRTEQSLEDTLAANPEMLMPGLTLVGRQTPIAGGYLDLLGVDQNGQIVVFELKRGTLTREAVAQVIDYGSALESLNENDIASLVVKHGMLEIEGIDDFVDWYSQYSDEQQPASLKPVQMVLVGLGIDDNATRMVDFLARQGIQITLLTFYGYSYEGKTFLAKQVRIEPVQREPSRITLSRQERRKAREKAAIERARTLEVEGLLDAVIEGFTQLGPHRWSPLTDGYTLYRTQIKLPDGNRFNGLYSIRFTEDKRARITFSPMAVHLCEEEFKNTKTVEFFREPPPNFPPTDRVSDQWYCLFTEDEWQENKEIILGLASAVRREWNKAARETG